MRLIIFICVFIFSSAVSAKQYINDNRTKCATLELLRTKGIKSGMMAFVYWSSNHRGSDAAASMFNVYGGHRGSYYKHAGYGVRASMQF